MLQRTIDNNKWRNPIKQRDSHTGPNFASGEKHELRGAKTTRAIIRNLTLADLNPAFSPVSAIALLMLGSEITMPASRSGFSPTTCPLFQ